MNNFAFYALQTRKLSIGLCVGWLMDVFLVNLFLSVVCLLDLDPFYTSFG